MKNTLYENCMLCPRRCGVNRYERTGFCKSGVLPKVAHAGLHHWEEPCISGSRGSGAVFFSGCTLRCCYCQNREISAEGLGREITVPELSRIFLSLQDMGAHNINLVTASHFVPSVLEALELLGDRLMIPVVYNSSGYETRETIALLKGYVDIFLPDFKYFDPAFAVRFSSAPSYPDIARDAILQMAEQVGPPVFGKDGMLKSGLILRHLALPSLREDTFRILEWFRDNLKGKALLSLMSQYTPMGPQEYRPLERRLSTYEYNLILEKLFSLGLEDGYVQEREAAGKEYIPAFDPEHLPF